MQRHREKAFGVFKKRGLSVGECGRAARFVSVQDFIRRHKEMCSGQGKSASARYFEHLINECLRQAEFYRHQAKRYFKRKLLEADPVADESTEQKRIHLSDGSQAAIMSIANAKDQLHRAHWLRTAMKKTGMNTVLP